MIHIKPQDVGKTTLAELAELKWSIAFCDVVWMLRLRDQVRQEIFVGQREALLTIVKPGYVSHWRIYCGDRPLYQGRADVGPVSPLDTILAIINWGGG